MTMTILKSIFFFNLYLNQNITAFVTIFSVQICQIPIHSVLFHREELKKCYSSSAEGKIDEEYKRTKDDYYRMELDKVEEYHPSNRANMRATYFAYLQNNPGSRKAIYECVKSTEQKQKEKESEKAEMARSQKSTARSRQPESARSTHSQNKQTQAIKA